MMMKTEIEKYLTHKSKGGYSDCIYGSALKTSLWKGSTVPNCIGLAWGLFNYFRGTKDNFKRISTFNNMIVSHNISIFRIFLIYKS